MTLYQRQVFTQEFKQPERGVNHPTPSSTEVKEKVEWYLSSPTGPSWPARGWTFRVQWTYHPANASCDATLWHTSTPTRFGIEEPSSGVIITNCTAEFLDISQAFDKVWHEGLLYKLNTFLLDNMYRIINLTLRIDTLGQNTGRLTRPSGKSSPEYCKAVCLAPSYNWSTLLTYPPWQTVQLPPSLMIPLS